VNLPAEVLEDALDVAHGEAVRFAVLYGRAFDEIPDIRQDGLLLLIEALGGLTHAPSNWRPFARIVIRRRLLSLYFTGHSAHARADARNDGDPDELPAADVVAGVEAKVTLEQLIARFNAWKGKHSFTTRVAPSMSADATKFRIARFVDFSRKQLARNNKGAFERQEAEA
jgi:DNA-directed RNA polymerase specialized sigma24 family protein